MQMHTEQPALIPVIGRPISDALAWTATLLIERLMDVLIDRGAMTISPAKGAEVLRMLHLATQGEVQAVDTDTTRTWAASSTWTTRSVTHSANLRITLTVGREHEGYRLTLADHTSY